MALQHLRRGGDQFRMLQTASGLYMAIYFCTHLLAVLNTRASGWETGWQFATGEKGLAFGMHFLIPYYSFSLLFFCLHALLGLRQISIAHKTNAAKTKLALQTLMTLGVTLTAITMLGALGFSIESNISN
jgi:succinate dehydrogenase hydrophobic anchor subunit